MRFKMEKIVFSMENESSQRVASARDAASLEVACAHTRTLTGKPHTESLNNREKAVHLLPVFLQRRHRGEVTGVVNELKFLEDAVTGQNVHVVVRRARQTLRNPRFVRLKHSDPSSRLKSLRGNLHPSASVFFHAVRRNREQRHRTLTGYRVSQCVEPERRLRVPANRGGVSFCQSTAVRNHIRKKGWRPGLDSASGRSLTPSAAAGWFSGLSLTTLFLEGYIKPNAAFGSHLKRERRAERTSGVVIICFYNVPK